MATMIHILSIVIMALLLAFSIIHLGVSIGIIVQFRKYVNVFRPQIGLSGFNIVISLFGLLAGALGIASIMMKQKTIGIIAAILAAITGVFALASLVSAIVINAKSLSYVGTRFGDHLLAYKTRADSKTTIDLLQTKYTCCGVDTWLDWSYAQLNGTAEMTTPTMTSITTTEPSDTTNPTEQTDNIITTTASNSGRKREIRQTNNDLATLLLTFNVTLPRSCCSSEAILTSTTSDAYCMSHVNNTYNHFYPIGCSKQIDMVAGNQAMGFAVINSFIIVLAFVAVPLLISASSGSVD